MVPGVAAQLQEQPRVARGRLARAGVAQDLGRGGLALCGRDDRGVEVLGLLLLRVGRRLRRNYSQVRRSPLAIPIQA